MDTPRKKQSDDEITTTDRTVMLYTLSGTVENSDSEDERNDDDRDEEEIGPGQKYKEVMVVLVHNNDDDTLTSVDEMGCEIPDAIVDRYRDEFEEISLMEAQSELTWERIYNSDEFKEFYDFNLERMVNTPYPFTRVSHTKNAKSSIDKLSSLGRNDTNKGDVPLESGSVSTTVTEITASNCEGADKKEENATIPVTSVKLSTTGDSVNDKDDIKEQIITVGKEPLSSIGVKRQTTPSKLLQNPKMSKKW